MNGVLALAMAISGGFFGTAVALTMFYYVVRVVIVRSLRNAHKVCPVCGGPMKQHAEGGGSGSVEVDDGR